MIEIGRFKEAYGEEYPSIREMIQEKPIKEKEIILAYLKKWDTGIRALKYLRDEITGEFTNEDFAYYCDGKYDWCTDVIYHFEKYNIKLEDDFIKYVLSLKTVK